MAEGYEKVILEDLVGKDERWHRQFNLGVGAYNIELDWRNVEVEGIACGVVYNPNRAGSSEIGYTGLLQSGEKLLPFEGRAFFENNEMIISLLKTSEERGVPIRVQGVFKKFGCKSNDGCVYKLMVRGASLGNVRVDYEI